MAKEKKTDQAAPLSDGFREQANIPVGPFNKEDDKGWKSSDPTDVDKGDVWDDTSLPRSFRERGWKSS